MECQCAPSDIARCLACHHLYCVACDCIGSMCECRKSGTGEPIRDALWAPEYQRLLTELLAVSGFEEVK